jgi:predicted kinase
MDNQKTIYATIGIPASGKTTTSKAYAKDGCTVISSDAIRFEICGSEEDQSKNKEVFKLFYQRANIELSKGNDIFLDATFVNDKNREGIKHLAVEHNAKIVWLYHNVSLQEALKRNKERSRFVPEKVIRKMFTEMTLPLGDEVIFLNKDFEREKKDAVIFDIDGTIAHNNGHREFFDYTKVYDDEVIQSIVDLIPCFRSRGYYIIFLSGREDTCMEDTRRWLNNKCDFYFNYGLLMRPEHDFRKDWVVKWELYETLVKPSFNVKYVFDDRNQVVNMWRKIGLTCLQVADGDF